MNRVYVIVQGGLVQSVLADDPTNIDAVVVDYDVDVADAVMIPQTRTQDGFVDVEGEEPAHVGFWSNLEEADDIFRAAITKEVG